jgi:hypothetical protein
MTISIAPVMAPILSRLTEDRLLAHNFRRDMLHVGEEKAYAPQTTGKQQRSWFSTLPFLVLLCLFCAFQVLLITAWKGDPSIASLFCFVDATFVGKTLSIEDDDDDSLAVASSSSSTNLAQAVTNDDLEGVIPRSFPKWNYKLKDMCVSPDADWWSVETQRTPAKEGILFVKEMKTGSSTLAGVTIRIARALARRHHPGRFRLCNLRFDHCPAYRMEYKNRIKERSFLWTVLRDPTKRAISQFFHFQVSREKVEPNDKNFREYITRPLFHNYYLRDLSLERYDPENDGDHTAIVNNLLQDYDFIGLTERMDETLVVMKMLLGLKTSDVLYLSAKSSGGWDDGGLDKKCFYIVPSYLSPSMKDYLYDNSTEWKEWIHGDELLYKAAQRSLDMTIDKLGRDTVQKELDKFRYLKTIADSTCKVTFPCSADGVLKKSKDCLWHDSGCGVHCLDQIEQDYEMDKGEEYFKNEEVALS